MLDRNRDERLSMNGASTAGPTNVSRIDKARHAAFAAAITLLILEVPLPEPHVGDSLAHQVDPAWSSGTLAGGG